MPAIPDGIRQHQPHVESLSALGGAAVRRGGALGGLHPRGQAAREENTKGDVRKLKPDELSVLAAVHGLTVHGEEECTQPSGRTYIKNFDICTDGQTLRTHPEISPKMLTISFCNVATSNFLTLWR